MEKKTHKVLIRVLKEHLKTLHAMKSEDSYKEQVNKNPKLEKHLNSKIEKVEFLLSEFK